MSNENIGHRLSYLEQRLEVMQTELNGALKEIQVTIEGLARLTQVGLKGLDARIHALETPIRTEEGKDL